MAISSNSGAAKLVLLCPAWKNWGTARAVKADTMILHSTEQSCPERCCGMPSSIFHQISGVPTSSESKRRVREPPMAFDESLAGRIRDALARKKNIEERKMFGCICFLLNGNALAGVWKDQLIARIGLDEAKAALR